MIEELRNLLNNAYAPYSNYRVSAILIDENNNKYTGVNIENASFGATICAERVAITKAVSEGARKFIELNIMVSSEKIGTCCFMCRQVITEFLDKNCIINCYNILGEKKTFKVSDLCPYPFDEENLK